MKEMVICQLEKCEKYLGITKRNQTFQLMEINIYYITFLIYNAKISDNNAESGKVPRMLAAFPRWMAREILSKRNFLDFESPDSAISRSPMTLMKSIIK
jgi:hypothetical protein